MSKAYAAYLRGQLTFEEWKQISRDSNLSFIGSTFGIAVIYVINPALGITVYTGTLLASVFDEYVVQAKKYKHSKGGYLEIQLEDLEELDATAKIAYLKGNRIVPITQDQVEALQDMKKDFINLGFEIK